MDREREPGIFFEKVVLKKCLFEMRSVKQSEIKKQMKIDFKIDNRLNDKKNILFTDFSVVIGKDDEEMPFLLDVVVTGIFKKDDKNENMDLDTFSKGNAAVILFPYLREFISNITLRAGFSNPLVLPPMNIAKLMKEKSTLTTKK
ncbi:MAG: protein-export chaperone SecB [bacterium]|nr:protein-export chaperone SecB [bacterium]